MKKEYYLDGVKVMLTEDEAKEYNIRVIKGNGYSHSYEAIERYDPNKHIYECKRSCQFTGRIMTYIKNQLTTEAVTEYIQGTSEVSFS
jgi:hypothetical protein